MVVVQRSVQAFNMCVAVMRGKRFVLCISAPLDSHPMVTLLSIFVWTRRGMKGKRSRGEEGNQIK